MAACVWLLRSRLYDDRRAVWRVQRPNGAQCSAYHPPNQTLSFSTKPLPDPQCIGASMRMTMQNLREDLQGRIGVSELRDSSSPQHQKLHDLGSGGYDSRTFVYRFAREKGRASRSSARRQVAA